MTTTANETGNARSAQTPQFLNKLSAMVDDPTTDRFIKWSDDGTSFYVLNPDQFAKELLGTYYKTDASASFVRQLNMYGFHKVPHVRQGALKSDKQAQAWHYRNPNFRRGRPDLLPYITRKGKAVGATATAAAAATTASAGTALALQQIKQPDLDNDLELLSGPIDDISAGATTDALLKAGSGELTKGGSGTPKNIDMSQIINGLATIKRHQTLISDNLKELQSSNQALWQEAMEARERHRKHQDTINRILKFLASLFQGSATTPIRTSSMSSATSAGEVVAAPIHRRPRLMIKDEQDGEEDREDTVSTPRSSVRMEEIELLDDEIPHAKVAIIETPKPPSTEKSPPTPKLPSASSSNNSSGAPSQYPFMPEQGPFLSNGTYIPPADAWKMIQWLQQNHIPIPGVSYPDQHHSNAGALMTMMPSNSGMPFNQLAFANALAAEMNSNGAGAGINFDSNGPSQSAPLGYNNNNGNNVNAAWLSTPASSSTTYNGPSLPQQQQSQQSQPQQPNSNAMSSLYPNPNQFLTSLLPLASMANPNDRAQDALNINMNLAQVSHNTDKLDQLSNHVEAMQQGIDSLIQGMGLDPMSAAALRAQQHDAAHAGTLLPSGRAANAFDMGGGGGSGLNQQQQQPHNVMSSSGMTNGMQQQQQQQQQLDGTGGPTNMQDPYASGPSDFDLDELLKHLGAAAAANTPPALHASSDGFPTMSDINMNMNVDHQSVFDPALFSDVNMDMYGQPPSQFYNLGGGGGSGEVSGSLSQQNQDARILHNQQQQYPVPMSSSSSAFLNEITTSPVMAVREASAEPTTKDEADHWEATTAASLGRGRTKKRNRDDSTGQSAAGIEAGTGTVAPVRAQSKGTSRASKRRK